MTQHHLTIINEDKIKHLLYEDYLPIRPGWRSYVVSNIIWRRKLYAPKEYVFQLKDDSV